MTLGPKTILAVKYRALGDSIIGLGGLQYLRQLFPTARILYGVPAWTAPLYHRVQTAADEIVPMDLKNVWGWFDLWGRLRSEGVDHIHEMFQSGRTRSFFGLYSVASKASYTYHDHHKKEGGQVHDQGIIKPVVQRDLDGIWSFLGKGQAVPEFHAYTPKIEQQELALKGKKIIFGVVATRPTKMWDLSRFLELARLFKDWEIVVPLSRSAVDLGLRRELENGPMPENMRCVHLPLEELPSLLASARLYIGNDTGLKHLAVAVGTKTMTFFGPEPPLEWHPYDKEQHPYFFLENLECRTRDAHYCGLYECDTMFCLKEFQPEAVWQRALAELERGGSL